MLQLNWPEERYEKVVSSGDVRCLDVDVEEEKRKQDVVHVTAMGRQEHHR